MALAAAASPSFSPNLRFSSSMIAPRPWLGSDIPKRVSSASKRSHHSFIKCPSEPTPASLSAALNSGCLVHFISQRSSTVCGPADITRDTKSRTIVVGLVRAAADDVDERVEGVDKVRELEDLEREIPAEERETPLGRLQEAVDAESVCSALEAEGFSFGRDCDGRRLGESRQTGLMAYVDDIFALQQPKHDCLQLADRVRIVDEQAHGPCRQSLDLACFGAVALVLAAREEQCVDEEAPEKVAPHGRQHLPAVRLKRAVQRARGKDYRREILEVGERVKEAVVQFLRNCD
ncbi:hypothetical protein DFH09DRAFT_1121300 [Mycena vulgaris]|nr:hypothetical protein DFH09DRAFT_1121300 [Mycena vulgaris]